MYGRAPFHFFKKFMDPICNACKVRHSPLLRCNDPRVVNTKPVVVNMESRVVNKDRHKKTEERHRYQVMWMQAKRAIASGKASPWPR